MIVKNVIEFVDIGISICAKCSGRSHRGVRFTCQFRKSEEVYCGIEYLNPFGITTFEKYMIREPCQTNYRGYLCNFADEIKDDIQHAINCQKALETYMAGELEPVDVKLDRISKHDQLVGAYRTEVKPFYEQKIQEELRKIGGNICELEGLRKPVVKDRRSMWATEKMQDKATPMSDRLLKARQDYNEKRSLITATTKTDVEVLVDAVKYTRELRCHTRK